MSCTYCNKKPTTKLSLCSRCLQAGYCDRTCQKNHWKEHKLLCVTDETTIKQAQIVVDRLEILKKEVKDKDMRDVVTIRDVDENIGIFSALFRYVGASKGETQVDSLMKEMSIYGSTQPLPIKHNHVAVLPSKIHGSGVFATKTIPANVIVTFYPCHAIHNTHTTEVITYPQNDGLDFVIDDHLLNTAVDYKFMLCPTHNLTIIGNPRRRAHTTLLGHLINDGASDVFANTSAEQLKKKSLLHGLILQYTKESTTASNCRYAPNANRTLVSIITTRPIEPGEELLVCYSTKYWLEKHYGWDFEEKYPFIPQLCKQFSPMMLRKIRSYDAL